MYFDLSTLIIVLTVKQKCMCITYRNCSQTSWSSGSERPRDAILRHLKPIFHSSKSGGVIVFIDDDDIDNSHAEEPLGSNRLSSFNLQG